MGAMNLTTNSPNKMFQTPSISGGGVPGAKCNESKVAMAIAMATAVIRPEHAWRADLHENLLFV